MYGLGEKIVPATCLGCNKTSCDFVPNCMDLIAAEMVEVAVIRPQATHGAQHTPEAPSV